MWQKKLWVKPAVLILPVLLLATALLAGCPGPTDPITEQPVLPLPDGWYKGSALPPYDDGYGIEAGILTYYTDGDKAVGFAGRVESYTNNVAIIKISSGIAWGLTEGKYYGVYINDATGFSFTGSSAYKESGANSGVDTLEAAQAEYTDANGYFEYKAGYGRYMGEAFISGIDSGLELSWTAIPGAAGYDVYFTETETPPTSATTGIISNVTTTGITATITGLTDTASYNVWVRAKNASHTGVWVYQGNASPNAEPVIIPALLDAYFQSLPFSAAHAFYDDGFAVDASGKTFYYYGDSTFEKKWGGPIVKIVPEGNAYIMIVQVTEVTGVWTPPPETGKYFAVAYKNLTDFAVYSSTAYKATDGNNTGVATVAAAASEYTIANGYFDYLDTTLYYPHATSATTLAPLQGNWGNSDIEDYFIQIKGTKLTEWADDGDGVYDADDDAYMLGELGDIVDHTNTAQSSGILYVKVIASDMMFGVDKYIAVAWKNKSGSGIQFLTNGGGTGYDTLAAAKAALNDANNTSQFPAGSFWDYEK
jgi:hypothetical protein